MRAIPSADFLPARTPQPLGADEIHLWFLPQWDRPAHAAAESAPIRTLLAGYLECAPDALHLERGEHGKPCLVGAKLEFNLAHSGGALLIALSRQVPLGVDLEAPRRTRPVLELARRWFDAAEATELAALPETLRQGAFLRLWSCKEAVLKAQGLGIGYGLDKIAFMLNAWGEIAGLRAPVDAAAPWQILGLMPATGFTGALAWQGANRPVRCFVLPITPSAIAPAMQSG